jgi:hypothetical protein
MTPTISPIGYNVESIKVRKVPGIGEIMQKIDYSDPFISFGNIKS